ncbi:TrbC/VirB2 family protein [Shewanella surugensis]|uniref:TrbC/VirB2 family protein n=1 Tax=Shewanella surugensis TaxID=212020 RepID=A0ABT0L684_9GAMM|nr:TrbC/VirB2 family protein [Shewanella surugensis]MCL1123193.1 TrbC/VirB2 family protein [Shewanella surugensis]
MKRLDVINSKTIITMALLGFVLFIIAISSNPMAQGVHEVSETKDITGYLCNVMVLLTGGLGKTFAAITVIVLGIGFFSGKIAFPTMIGVALGIGTMFGAPTIVAALSGELECSSGPELSFLIKYGFNLTCKVQDFPLQLMNG